MITGEYSLHLQHEREFEYPYELNRYLQLVTKAMLISDRLHSRTGIHHACLECFRPQGRAAFGPHRLPAPMWAPQGRSLPR